jgi:hypothetical protein
MKTNPKQLEVMPLFDARTTNNIESEFIEALYTQRLFESQIADYYPQSSAPAYLIKAYFNSKKRFKILKER